MKRALLLMRRAHERLIPWTATLELGWGCGLRCVHCYNFDRSGPAPARAPLTTADWLGVVEVLRSMGGHQVTLTGGEPLLAPGFWELLDRTRALGMAAAAITSGVGLTEAVAARLARYDHIVDVGISVYGVRGETHDAVTRRPGSFERTIGGARRLRRAGVPVTFKFVVMDLNVREAEEMPALAAREGAFVEVSSYLHPRHTGDLEVLRRRVRPEQMEAAYGGALRSMLPDGEGGLICNCARSNLGITSAGEVQPCISVPLPCGNIRDQSLETIWRESPQLNRIRQLEETDFALCGSCPLQGYCHRTPGPAYVLTGDYTGVDPWACQDAEVVRRVVTDAAK